MNIVQAFGYLVMTGGFGVLILFAFKVQDLVKTFDFSVLMLLPVSALLLFMGYALAQVGTGGSYE